VVSERFSITCAVCVKTAKNSIKKRCFNLSRDKKLLYVGILCILKTTKNIVVMSIKSIQDQEIHESLEQFGLALAEREVYLQLIQHGATTVTPLARSMEEPATTVQSILQRLAKLGVVHETEI
jgi:hypothetical protein